MTARGAAVLRDLLDRQLSSRVADRRHRVHRAGIEPGCAAERHEILLKQHDRLGRARRSLLHAHSHLEQPSVHVRNIERPADEPELRFPHERRRAVRLESNAGDADDTAGAEHQPAGQLTGKDGRWLARRGIVVETVERIAEMNDQLRTSIGEHRLQRP